MQNVVKQPDSQSTHHKPEHERLAQAGCAVAQCSHKDAGKGGRHKTQIMADYNEADNAHDNAADAAPIRRRAVIKAEMRGLFIIRADGARLFCFSGER